MATLRRSIGPGVILGINAYHAGAAAAVLVDGQVVAAVPEERLNRVKYYARFPSLAVKLCLEMAGVRGRDIDAVAVGRNSSANRAKKLEYVLRHPTRLLNLVKTQVSRGQLDDVRSEVASALQIDPSELRFKQHNVEHHVAHTASAYFISEWDRAAGFTLDGSGDFVTSMLSECVGNEIRVKYRTYVPHSLGALYTMICEFIGYGKYGDEGKVMGLAPLGKDAYASTFAEIVRHTDSGIELNPKYFQPFGSNQGMTINAKGEMVVHRHFSQFLIELFGPPREPDSEITERDQDLACSLQAAFEQAFMHLLRILHRRVPTERLAMAGGCVLNSVANGKLFAETPFRQTCIQPAAGDEGLAIGAALYVSNSILRQGKRYVMRNAFLGPEYSAAEIRQALDRKQVRHVECLRESLLCETATDVAAGKVVGWFQGRMEWGPRALGNRSIVAHPGRADMKDILNARIKRREPFRPFAPSVLAERQSELFEHDHPSPYMQHVYQIRPEWRQRLVAVNHLDNTGRVQSVARSENPLFYDLIKQFDSITGIPAILNTSFNENEPVVCTPGEAIDCFQRTRMDSLAIGPFLCRKDS